MVGGEWSAPAHLSWVAKHAAEQITFDTYLHAVDLVDARIEQLERAIQETTE